MIYISLFEESEFIIRRWLLNLWLTSSVSSYVEKDVNDSERKISQNPTPLDQDNKYMLQIIFSYLTGKKIPEASKKV